MSDLFKSLTDRQEIDPNTSVYETLVGEGKKFRDDEALARSKLESDSFIEQLKREASELREELTRRQSAEEIRTQILEGLKNQGTPSQQPPVTPPANGTPAPKEVDIEELVKSTLAKTEAERRTQTNREIVTQRLQQKFGQDAQIELNKIAKDLSVSLDYLERLAVESPAVFFKTVGLDQTPQQAPGTPAPRSNQGTPPPQSGVRNHAYYQRLKAQDPKAYFSPKVQNQMYKDALELRESFY